MVAQTRAGSAINQDVMLHDERTDSPDPVVQCVQETMACLTIE
jgi:ABC-type polar amino acid transport system ATPase subunit